MGLFQKIFRPDKDKEAEAALEKSAAYFKTLTAYRPVFKSWHGQIYESELVRAAIDARARHIGKLQVQIMGSAQPSLQTKLKAGPNQWSTWYQFLYRVSTILDVCNTAFIVPVMDEDLRVTGYWPALPEKCEIIQYKGEPWLRYKFRSGNAAAVELRRCAIMTKYQLKSDFFGSSNHALDETMDMIHVQDQGIKEAAKNSATYRFMAQISNFSKAEDLAKERKRFSEKNLSSESDAGGLLLFPNTYANIKQIESSPYTVDPEQRKLIQNNVFNYFGVSEKLLQNLATSDELDSFFNGVIEPWAIQFSEVMTKAMFTERERAAGTALHANANRLQYMNVSQKVTLAQQMLDRGVMSINEARELFNYIPVEGGDIRVIRGEYKDTDEYNDLTEEGSDEN